MKTLAIIALALGLSCPFYGQTANFHRLGQVFARAKGGANVQVVPNAQISVTDAATGVAAVIYSDPQLLVPINPPTLTANPNGLYDYYITPNECVTETVSSPSQGVQVIPYICQATSAQGAAGSTNGQVQYYNNGLLAASAATLDALGNFNTPKTVSGMRIGGSYQAANFSGADASVKINACIAAAVADGGGICDAQSFTGAQNATVPIVVGNSSSVAVALLLSPYLNLHISTNAPGQCAITVYSQSSLLDPGAGPNAQSLLNTASGANVSSLLCTAPGTNTSGYTRVQGVNVHYSTGVAGATISNALLEITGMQDGSSTEDVTVFGLGYAGVLVWEHNSCCGFSNVRLTANCNSTEGCTPLVVGGTATSPLDKTYGIQFYGSSFTHPGHLKNNVLIQGGGASSGFAYTYDVAFIHTQMECNTAVTQTASLIGFNQATGTTGIDFDGLFGAEGGGLCGTSWMADIPAGVGSVTFENMLCRTNKCINDAGANRQIVSGGAWNSTVPFYSTAQIPLYTLGNTQDSPYNLTLNGGLTASQSIGLNFADRGAVQWNLMKNAAGNFQLLDVVNASFPRIYVSPNWQTKINSMGAQADLFNVDNGSGTGGTQFGDGLGNVTAAVNNAGKGTFNGGVSVGGGSNVVYRCLTAGALPIGALTITAANCGTSTATTLTVN